MLPFEKGRPMGEKYSVFLDEAETVSRTTRLQSAPETLGSMGNQTHRRLSISPKWNECVWMVAALNAMNQSM
jgi:hypothetical protein